MQRHTMILFGTLSALLFLGSAIAPGESSSSNAQSWQPQFDMLRAEVDELDDDVDGVLARIADLEFEAHAEPPAAPVRFSLSITGLVQGGGVETIEVASWSWGATQSATVGSGGGASAGRVAVQDLHFSHVVDATSPKLFLACASGRHIPSAELTARKTNSSTDYLVITLEDVLVSSFQSSGASAGGTLPMEDVSLAFAKVKVEHVAQRADGTLSRTSGGWDLAAGRAT